MKFGIFLIFAPLVFLMSCVQLSEPVGQIELNDAEWRQRIQSIKSLKLQTADRAPADKAPKNVSLTLEQCRMIALENNLEIQAELINPKSRFHISSPSA